MAEPDDILNSVDTQERPVAKDVRALFSKRKVKPSTVQNLPPPPPPPAPKISGDSSSTSDEGWEREFQKLDFTLRERGLCIEKVESDGSCLFSSFAAHFPGTSSETLRQEAVDFMSTNPDDFAPFIDCEAYPNGFDDYCARMRRKATWGGQLEIQALSLARKVNVYVFQTGGKSTVKMVNFDERLSQCVTVSYHDGEHYNSVLRLEGDEPITAEWLEEKFKEKSGYVDTNPVVPRVIKGRRKAGLFN